MADDPFFADEDDGDFDDLYGKPAPTLSPPRKTGGQRFNCQDDDDFLRSPAPSSRASPLPRKSQPTFPNTPRDWSSSQQQPRPSASAASSQDEAGTNVKTQLKSKKMRRKGSQELFDAGWEDESRVTKCSICASGFSLVRRKHHCRPCGRVMCSDCSSFLFFELSQRKHRVCSACAADHSSAARAARHAERDALFDHGSDAEPELAVEAGETPSSVASNTRGGFRASVMQAITPSSGSRGKQKKEKLKKKKERATTKDQQSGVPASQLTGEDVAVAVDGRSHVVGPGLFNTAGDTWFTEPADEEEGKRKPKASTDMGRAFPDADYSDGFADSSTSTSRTAADEWREQVKATYELQLDQTARVEVAAPSGFGFGRATFSEQYRYDDDPLEYEDDWKSRESMPRPEPVAAVELETKPKPKANSLRREPVEAPDNLRQSTLKVNLKGLFHGKSKKEKKRDRREKAKEDRAERVASQRSEVEAPVEADRVMRTSANQRMTLDELEIAVKPSVVGASAMRPTFYDDDADDLVVDDSPGYFEANLVATSADKRKQEELQRKLAEDAAWINGAAAPTPGGNRFSSEQESFSIVDAPSHGASSSPESAANNTSAALAGHGDKSKEHGLTGALKRFFGMSIAAKTPEKTAVSTTNGAPESGQPVDRPVPRQPSTPVIEMSSRRSIAENYAGDRALSFRHSLGDMDQMPALDRQDVRDLSALRFTVAGDLDAHNSLRPGTFMVPKTEPERLLDREPSRKKSRKSLKRRDTFDDLFASPKAVDRHNEAASGLPSQSWGAVAVENTPAYALGVDRFDAFNADREDEPDEFMPSRRISHIRSSDAYRESPSDDRYNSAPVLKSRRESDDAFESPTKTTGAFTWSSVQAASGVGTATYALPTGVTPRDSRFGGDRFASTRAKSDDEGAAPPHNIMQDLHRRSVSGDARRKRSTGESVDDIFAQFERPNDYVFDPATGSYVPNRPAPQTSRREKKKASAPRETFEADEVIETRSFIGRRPSDHRRSDSAKSVKAVESRATSAEVDDSDSNESDDVIVDKISSLEGELAALKRLIKKRKGGNANTDVSTSAPRPSKPRAVANANSKPRKESIFDGDSSDSDKEVPGARWPTSSTRRQVGEKTRVQQRKARRDSFASLFDDDPVEDSSIAGGGGYDALFQTGPSKDDDSDEDVTANARSPTVRRQKKRRPSKKLSKTVAEPAVDGFGAPDEEEEELTSLKDRRGGSRQTRRSSKERSAPSWGDDSPDEPVQPVAVETERVPEVKTRASVVASSSKIASRKEDDLIDALFDTADDADMTDLFGGDVKSDAQADPVPEKKSTRQASSTRRRLSDGDSDEDDSNAAPAVAGVLSKGPTERQTSSLAGAVSNGVVLTPASVAPSDGSDSEEEFAINWKKVKSGRARRQTRPQVSFVAITGTDVTTASDVEVESTTTKPEQEVETTVEPSPGPSEEDVGTADSEDHDPLPVSSASESAASPGSGQPVSTEADRLEAVERSVLDDTSDSVTTDIDTTKTDQAVSSDDQPMAVEPVAAVETSAAMEEELPPTLPTKPVVLRPRVADDLFMGDADEDSLGLFDRSDDFDLHLIMGGGASAMVDDGLATSSTPLPSALTVEGDDGDGSSSGEEDGGDAAFSFEIRPQRRKTPTLLTVEPVVPRSSSIASSSTASDDDYGSLILGKYARAPPSQSEATSLDGSRLLGASVSSLDSSTGVDAQEDDGDLVKGPSVSADSVDAFDADWQAMQEQEKQRKKKLQMKQRQAQRDKLMLKKQHSRLLTAGPSDGGGADSKTSKKQSKKKKKKESKDDAAPSSRKHRHREKTGKSTEEPAPASGSLTEL